MVADPSSTIPQAAVQRLLVYHAALPRACTGRDALDESASDEEAAECVLYYRTARSLRSDNAEEAEGPRSTSSLREIRECVQFLGICQALHRLPASLAAPDTAAVLTESNATHDVHLGGSLLVFEVLEAPHVVAVAQVSRRSSAAPRAVRAMLRKSHQLFCLFRGGAILRRMGDYDRMRQLYELHRQQRSLLLESESKGGDELRTQVASKDLTDLRCNLPITALRDELRIHYDTLLEDLLLSAAEGGGAGRSIVECVPTPVRLRTGRYSSDIDRSPVGSSLVGAINARIKEYLIHQSQEAGSIARVVAVSTFEHATLAGTLISDDTAISDDAAILLFTQMSILRTKMYPSLDSGDSAAAASTTSRGYMSVTFGKDMVENAATSASTVPCNFMAPPPLALLSASDNEEQGFQGPVEGTRVWAPRVSLPQVVAGTVADVRIPALLQVPAMRSGQ
jgi:hypothetical protein